ncbi:hypothetical protein B9Z55_022222 [Caenorhabditis nigoni]|uniref:Uncharacterized protein n=1 Tax=Caenorhabditis nigoni TaxID=1611254 RepID=A0A2G5SJA1_9PELO|nr:hypothetical protein B9Z55_022222 [Caenorhabditis nigoni]
MSATPEGRRLKNKLVYVNRTMCTHTHTRIRIRTGKGQCKGSIRYHLPGPFCAAASAQQRPHRQILPCFVSYDTPS